MKLYPNGPACQLQLDPKDGRQTLTQSSIAEQWTYGESIGLEPAQISADLQTVTTTQSIAQFIEKRF